MDDDAVPLRMQVTNAPHQRHNQNHLLYPFAGNKWDSDKIDNHSATILHTLRKPLPKLSHVYLRA